MSKHFMFTSESVTAGHPDKLCDQISDAIVDRYLSEDALSHVNAECAVAKGVVFLATRVASRARVDVVNIAREVIAAAGYDDERFNARDCTVVTSISELPREMRQQANERDMDDKALDHLHASQQVTVFGFACTQTDMLMPLPIRLAHKLAWKMTQTYLAHEPAWLAPDGKTQVGVQYRDRRAERIHSISVVASQQRPGDPDADRLRQDVMDYIVAPALKDESISFDAHTHIYVNPEGPFIGGGPALHAGLTGRKNAMDAYGEYARLSGAALSGKDPSRIDRVGAYAARHAAKNIVAAGLATECEVQLSYTIGAARPVSVQVETFGTGTVDDDELEDRISKVFDFRTGAIIRRFGLRELPVQNGGKFYERLATFGHMGRQDIELPWEATDMAAKLR
jgi:S-adenosylmethionine synthetase